MISVNFESGSQLTSIGQNAFYNTGLTTITIPASVTNIANHAFRNCISLASILVASGITYSSSPGDTILTFWDTPALSNVFFYNKTDEKFYTGVKTDENITQGSSEITNETTPSLNDMAAYFGSDAAAGKAYITSLGYIMPL